MDEIAAETAKWITERYGPITFEGENPVIASVPVYGDGKAEGKGTTQSEAIVSLYKDLTPGRDMPPVDQPTETNVAEKGRVERTERSDLSAVQPVSKRGCRVCFQLTYHDIRCRLAKGFDSPVLYSERTANKRGCRVCHEKYLHLEGCSEGQNDVMDSERSAGDERETEMTRALTPSEFEARGLMRSRYHDRLFAESKPRPTNEQFDEGWDAARQFYASTFAPREAERQQRRRPTMTSKYRERLARDAEAADLINSEAERHEFKPGMSSNLCGVATKDWIACNLPREAEVHGGGEWATCSACKGTGRGQGDNTYCGRCGGDGTVEISPPTTRTREETARAIATKLASFYFAEATRLVLTVDHQRFVRSIAMTTNTPLKREHGRAVTKGQPMKSIEAAAKRSRHHQR